MCQHSLSSLSRSTLCLLASIVKKEMLAGTHFFVRDSHCQEQRVAKRKDSYATEFARKGGKARAEKLTAEQRKDLARKAAQARWAKAKGKPKK